MHIISSFLFGLSANADSFVIGVAYGLKKRHISPTANLLIGLITSLGTMVSIGLGSRIGAWIPQSIGPLIGSSFLILLGLYYLISFSRKKEPTDLQSSDCLPAKPTAFSWKEAFCISLALSLNNAGMGIGASISGIPMLLTSVLSFGFSVLFLFFGNWLGENRLPCSFSQWAEGLSGIVIILLGVYELVI